MLRFFQQHHPMFSFRQWPQLRSSWNPSFADRDYDHTIPEPLQALTDVVVAPIVPNLPPCVFGFVAFVHLHKHQRNKLTPRALRCMFIGYAIHQKGYRCYHPPTQRMFITMDVVFHEDSIYFSSESELQGEYHKEIHTLDYDFIDYEFQISEKGEVDVPNVLESENQEVGELDLSGINMDQSGD